MFDSKEKLKAYNNLTDDQKGLGANGLGVTVATGSSLDGQKTFELTEKGANISFIKNNEDKLKVFIKRSKRYSKRRKSCCKRWIERL